MLTRAAYQASYRHRALWQGNAAEYHRAYPALHTPGERLIAINALIHSFHIDAKSKRSKRTSVAIFLRDRDPCAFWTDSSALRPCRAAARRAIKPVPFPGAPPHNRHTVAGIEKRTFRGRCRAGRIAPRLLIDAASCNRTSNDARERLYAAPVSIETP